MITISLEANIAAMRSGLDAVQREQLPFATALGLTTLAKHVQAGERAALPTVFDRPTAFTLNAFAIKPARKTDLEAAVFAKDVQARYLEPFEDGGRQVLGGKQGLPVPKDIPVNRYGNLPRNAIARLKRSKKVFFGAITFKGGDTVSGVWRRLPPGSGGAGTKREPGKLELLIRWGDGVAVKPGLNFRERARAIVARRAMTDLNAALTKALESRRP